MITGLSFVKLIFNATNYIETTLTNYSIIIVIITRCIPCYQLMMNFTLRKKMLFYQRTK